MSMTRPNKSVLKEKKLLWKFLIHSKKGIHSLYGNVKWIPMKWKYRKEILICEKGFHASEYILDALSNMPENTLARVEVAGEFVKWDNKSVHQRMRIIEAKKWKIRDSKELGLFVAEKFLQIFEKTSSPTHFSKLKAIYNMANNYLNAKAPTYHLNFMLHQEIQEFANQLPSLHMREQEPNYNLLASFLTACGNVTAHVPRTAAIDAYAAANWLTVAKPEMKQEVKQEIQQFLEEKFQKLESVR